MSGTLRGTQTPVTQTQPLPALVFRVIAQSQPSAARFGPLKEVYVALR